MSLWTPGGEHEVPRESPQTTGGSAPAAASMADLTGDPEFDNLSPEEQAQAQAMMAEMAEVQQRIAASPASDDFHTHTLKRPVSLYIGGRVGADWAGALGTSTDGSPAFREVVAR